MFAASTTRVTSLSSRRANQAIQESTQQCIERYSQHPEQIDQRLKELDREWDVERALETGSATLSLIGLGLGFMHDRRWFLLPLAVQTFFLQHALQGWCPPLPLFRALGFRTEHEIEVERHALKALRGDFERVRATGTPHTRARRAFSAARRGSPNGSSSTSPSSPSRRKSVARACER